MSVNHPDWPAFVSAILADPDDDTVRLVAADFLEEHGDPDRAAFIRIQCALARLEVDESRTWRALAELRSKERTFLGPLSTFRLLWAAEACPELVHVKPPARGTGSLVLSQVEGTERLTWRRGFVEAVTCPAADWLRHGVAVRARQPVRQVALLNSLAANRDDWYAGLGALRGLSKVALEPGRTAGAENRTAWLREWLPGTEIDDIP